MNIIQCDGCEKQSPSNGIYLANNWIKIKIELPSNRTGGNRKEFILCEDCFGLKRKGEVPKDWVQAIKNLFKGS